MNGKNLVKKLRNAALGAAAVVLGAGSAFGYSVGCPEGPRVKVSYESRSGPVSGTYSCTTAKGEPNPKEKRIVGDYDAFNLLDGNGAQFLAYTKNDGWNTADPNNLAHRGFFPFNKYTQGTFNVESVPQEKPTAPSIVYVPRYTHITKTINHFYPQPKTSEGPQEKSGIFARVSNSGDVSGYSLGFNHGNLGFGLEAGKKGDENLERTSIVSPTGRTLEGSIDNTNQKYLGIFTEGHIPFNGWNIFGGAGIRKWEGDIKTTERIADPSGATLAHDSNTSHESENSWTIHAGAEVDIGESLRAGILGTYDSKLKEIIPGLGVSYRFN